MADDTLRALRQAADNLSQAIDTSGIRSGRRAQQAARRTWAVTGIILAALAAMSGGYLVARPDPVEFFDPLIYPPTVVVNGHRDGPYVRLSIGQPVERASIRCNTTNDEVQVEDTISWLLITHDPRIDGIIDHAGLAEARSPIFVGTYHRTFDPGCTLFAEDADTADVLTRIGYSESQIDQHARFAFTTPQPEIVRAVSRELIVHGIEPWWRVVVAGTPVDPDTGSSGVPKASSTATIILE